MINVGVVFGGVSPEHEVSIISSLQAAAALDKTRYRAIPIYIAKDGTWYTGEGLLDVKAYQDLDALRRNAVRVTIDPGSFGTIDLVDSRSRSTFFGSAQRYQIDVMFLGLHGGEGENGSLQGLCETFNVPYTGSSVMGSAIGMDKVLSKMLCRDQGIPVVRFVSFRELEWAYHEEKWLDQCERELGYPVVVKPSRLGSSIGIAKVDNRAELDAAIEEAMRYDDKIIVEYGVRDLREINCSVLGDPGEAMSSMLEEPVRSKGEEMLTFQEKYMRGENGSSGSKTRRRGAKAADRPGGMASLDRIIPALLSESRTREIQQLGVRVFQLFECAGVARIDFMIDGSDNQVYFNEINTIPGSFSFYLWEPIGIPFDDLTHRMIELARKRHREKNGRVRFYDTNLLSLHSLKGMKGAKTQP